MIFLMNIDIQILNKTLANRIINHMKIHEYVKRIIYHGVYCKDARMVQYLKSISVIYINKLKKKRSFVDIT